MGTKRSTARSAPDEFAPEEVALRPREVEFRWDECPLHWIPGDPYGSHAVTALNLIVPAAERWFSKVLVDAMEYVRDDAVRAEIIGFIGQEAVHASTHERVLVDYLKQRGIDPGPFVRQVDWIVSLYDQRVAAAGPNKRRKAIASATHILCGAEHFTCILGHWALNNTWDNLDVDPVMADFYRWHGAEEVEHRHVSYNVAKYFAMDYVAQALSGALVTAGAFAMVFRGTKYLVRQDPALPNLGYVRLLWKLRASARRGSVPPLGYLLTSAARMLRRDYEPVNEASTAQAIAYLATSPAARAHG
ncbi:metal-dependent hydrolase [Mycobacterium sp. ACS4331]|uniref:metal-dependent hydrolase n=1 Tax=Mycobacterium sp. ACS4331 TaxID=1834121 RepID=UPI0007FF7CDA|nr:metal-dependent hydrolase [Mycobacterium sp. ACS4331]OBF25024.1 metal-dependent hydrolase [Mycobacterium sp. ACS4331]